MSEPGIYRNRAVKVLCVTTKFLERYSGGYGKREFISADRCLLC
jgi:hypothetical protein